MNGLSFGGKSNVSWYPMFEGIIEMNEHFGHAGSGVGRGEWHFGHLLGLEDAVVDNILRWAADQSAARLSGASSWWHLNDIRQAQAV